MEVHQAIFKMNLLKLTTPVSVLNLEPGVNSILDWARQNFRL